LRTPGFAPSRSFVATAAVGVVVFAAPSAGAFERQWHFGGGLGVAAPSDGYAEGPAFGVHGAYGLSDVFDARLELQASRNAAGELPVWFYGARLGLAYKLDVIQWIPYAGASLGGFALAGNERALVKPSAGAFVGLDYAVSRNFGVGVFGAGDYVFVDSGVTMLSLLVRAEYRFGW
jgi:hypothetical protein